MNKKFSILALLVSMTFSAFSSGGKPSYLAAVKAGFPSSSSNIAAPIPDESIDYQQSSTSAQGAALQPSALSFFELKRYTKLDPKNLLLKMPILVAALKDGITKKSATLWYDIANEFRHMFNDQNALDFTKKIYKTLVNVPCITNDLKSISYRCLSKCYGRMKNKAAKTLRYALEAEQWGRSTNSYGQTLCYIGDVYHYHQKNIPVASTFYVRSLNWCKPRNMRVGGAEALIGLGDTQYTNAQTTDYSVWYRKALNLLAGIPEPELRSRAYQGLAVYNTAKSLENDSSDRRKRTIRSRVNKELRRRYRYS